jgi:hypothetical protein
MRRLFSPGRASIRSPWSTLSNGTMSRRPRRDRHSSTAAAVLIRRGEAPLVAARRSARGGGSHPDARIMIPTEFGLAIRDSGPVGHAIGHNRRSRHTPFRVSGLASRYIERRASTDRAARASRDGRRRWCFQISSSPTRMRVVESRADGPNRALGELAPATLLLMMPAHDRGLRVEARHRAGSGHAGRRRPLPIPSTARPRVVAA